MTIAPCAWASRGDLDRVGRLDEAGLREVRRMDAQDDASPGPSASGASKSDGARPVGRPDLDQPGAGSSDDLRDPDAAADLDQLAARDRDPVPAGEPDREHECGRVVDRDQRVLGAGQRDEVLLRGAKPRPATAGVAVELEERVATGRPGRGLDRGRAATAPARGSCARSRPVALMTCVKPLPAAGSANASSRSATSRQAPTTARPARDRARLARLRQPRSRSSARPVAARLAGDRVSAARPCPRPAVAPRPEPRTAAAASTLGGTRAIRSTSGPLRGGNAWESNPPRRAERRATGFEDQGTHRDPTAPSAMVARPRALPRRGAPIIGP